jgi:hypothetical protein
MKALLALTALILAAPHTPPAALTAVLVELFTSEGCSSCPAADTLLASLAKDQPVAGAEIVALAFHVDYWDQQGWKDPYSSKVFTARQQAYSRVFGEKRMYTPQLVVDGRQELTGSDEAAATRAIGEAMARPHLPIKIDARVQGAAVRLSVDLPPAPANAEPIDVVVALAEDGLSSVVKRGENAGRTLTHVAVVRALQTLGPLDRESVVADGQLALQRAWHAPKMRAVVWLQGQKTRHVYGAAMTGLAR